jgi:hypothetical protein
VAAGARRGTAVAAVLAMALGACATHRIVDGVYHSPNGYRVTLPGEAWEIEPDTRADLELRNRTAPAGMLANVVCDPAIARRDWDVLALQLLVEMRERTTVTADETPVNGRTASHRVLEGRMREGNERVRVESYTLKVERCVYDLLYVAAPEAFDTWRGDFQRFVASFAGE